LALVSASSAAQRSRRFPHCQTGPCRSIRDALAQISECRGPRVSGPITTSCAFPSGVIRRHTRLLCNHLSSLPVSPRDPLVEFPPVLPLPHPHALFSPVPAIQWNCSSRQPRPGTDPTTTSNNLEIRPAPIRFRARTQSRFFDFTGNSETRQLHESQLRS
jgi:hypothetical protein